MRHFLNTRTGQTCSEDELDLAQIRPSDTPLAQDLKQIYCHLNNVGKVYGAGDRLNGNNSYLSAVLLKVNLSHCL